MTFSHGLHREGLCPGPAAIDARGLRATASPAGPCPGRLRRGGGGGRGRREKVAFFCLILPHSNLWFVKAYPRETTEAFLDGHVSAFAFLGGVPRSILYDNTTLAVARILGDGTRRRTQAFTHLQSHYLFRDRFGRPGKGNDKGKVEALVKTARRRFMVPIPKVHDLSVLNERLLARCLERPRRAGGRGEGGGAARRSRRLARSPGFSLRGLRACAGPDLVHGPGALSAGGLLGADGARPQEGHGEGLCRPGRDRARRRDRPPAPETIVPPNWPPGSATLRRSPSLAKQPSMH